ncbi:HU family DNA-binding protein [Sandaracinobacter sp. RS1-74]|nr:HU family DNA-binding protein [Sandaracinobacteroides sayramensis]
MAGFGKLTTRKRAASDVRNPQADVPMPIKASKSISFRPAKALKDKVNL